jgi:hypothetical protein
MEGNEMNHRILLCSLLIVLLLCVGVGSAADLTKAVDEKTIAMKTISSKELLEDTMLKSQNDFAKRTSLMTEATVDTAKIDKEIISVAATVKPRTTGGITIELFCQDNMGYFMPVWGGSITKDKQSWDFTPKDAMRKDIDGCYFAIVDSNKEMAL